MGKIVEFSVAMKPTAAMSVGTVKEDRPHVAGSTIDMRVTICDNPSLPKGGFLWAVIERWPDQMQEAVLIAGHKPTLIEASVAAQCEFERVLRERKT